MGIYSIAESVIKHGVKRLQYVTPSCHVGTANELGIPLEKLVGDTVLIKHKSPLNEFMSYIQNVAREGKSYKPTFENPDSAFAKYWEAIENWNKEAALINEKIKLCKGPKIYRKTKQVISGDWSKSVETQLGDYTNYKLFLFENAEKLGISKSEYMQVAEEVAKLNKEFVKQQPSIRKEIADRFDDITRWNDIFHTQCQDWVNINHHKFYDEIEFNKAVNEYIKFVEDITKKKVLIPCRSRMELGSSFIGVLNNPKNYQDFDYLLINHGKNSSLITDITHPNTWRFSDNGESIWEYIEANVEKGKRVLVSCCETDGLEKALDAGVKTPEEIKYIRENMFGIGNTVINSGVAEPNNPLKICESGIRHIIGHTNSKKIEPLPLRTTCGCNSMPIPTDEMVPVYYKLDFDKYRVENLV